MYFNKKVEKCFKKDKKEILKTARKNKSERHFYLKMSNKVNTKFSSETMMKIRRQWIDIFQVPKENNQKP